MSQKIDPEIIIEEVKRHPTLWDKRRNDYFDTDKKENIWEVIATGLKLPCMYKKLKKCKIY